MSQSDWQFTLRDPSYSFIGGTSGSAKLHTDFQNPLTHSGDWCREFANVNNTGANNYLSLVSMVPINNSQLTSSAGYEYGNAYSMRCWVRQYDSCNFFMIFKGQSNLNVNFNLYQDWPLGYVLAVNGRSIGLRVSNSPRYGWSESLEPGYNSWAYAKNYIANLTNDCWTGLRMDVSPVTGSADRITLYTASYTSPDVWHSIHTVDIPRTKIGAYIPWANNPNGDGAAAAGYGYMGIDLLVVYNTNPFYIDGFEVYKEVTALP